MDEARCAYKECNERVNTPHDQTLCIFHAPVEKKGVILTEFNELIWRRINKNNYNFRGFIFPGKIYFRGECKKQGGPIEFNNSAYFSDAVFAGDVDFRQVQFKIDAFFSGAKFGSIAEFYRTQFKRIAYFKEAKFLCKVYFGGAIFSSDAIFDNAVFSEDANFGKHIDPEPAVYDVVNFSAFVSFRETEFLKNAYFSEINFPREAKFIKAIFSGNSEFVETNFEEMVDFSGAIFRAESNFNSTRFNEKTSFIENKIGSKMSFYNVRFSDKTVFYFINPKTLNEARDNNSNTILFERIRFIPFSTYFEHVRISRESSVFIFIFRYCQLENVYFTNDDMSLFSFYKSSFELAQFISCEWSYLKDRILFIPFKRKNIIPEEKFLSGTVDKDDFKASDLNSYEDVASLYRRMKTSLDNAKDYQQASLFYFNEFEMKRWALQKKFEIELQKRIFVSKTTFNILGHFFRRLCSKLPFYNLYKILAGYGEKPLWSFIWFWIFAAFFAFGHMIFGLKVYPGDVVPTEYDFFSFLKDFRIIEFVKEFGNAFGYAISRAIPKNYIPYKISNMNPNNPFGIVWSILNTIVLWILIIFMGIGLKRHFRRF